MSADDATNFLNRDKALCSAALGHGREVILRAAELLSSASYVCPTCGRPQHPGETCQPGHVDDDNPT